MVTRTREEVMKVIVSQNQRETQRRWSVALEEEAEGTLGRIIETWSTPKTGPAPLDFGAGHGRDLQAFAISKGTQFFSQCLSV